MLTYCFLYVILNMYLFVLSGGNIMKTRTKKVISLVLTLVMVFGLIGTSGIIPASALRDSCGYEPAMTMSELANSGKGAEAGSSYSISSADELLAFAAYVNSGKATEGATFYLMADIKLTETAWTPIGSASTHAFKGIFDGCGFAVLDLVSLGSADNYALFGYVSGETAVIKNLGVVGRISGRNNVAGIAANLNAGTIANCWSSVELSAAKNVGGIAGHVTGGKIYNCCDYGHIVSGSNAGAIAGSLTSGSVVEYSYYVYYRADSACGYVDASSTQTVYRFASSSTEVLTEAVLTVGNKDTDNLITLLNEWVDMQDNKLNYRDWSYDVSTQGTARVGGRFPAIEYPGYIRPVDNLYKADATMTALYDTMQDAEAGKYYSISDVTELNYFAEYVNLGHSTEGATFFLTNDIMLAAGITSPEAINWTPIANDKDHPFRGIFDGQGYIIIGAVNNKGSNLGLFGFVNDANAVIKNVGVYGYFLGNDKIGGIAGNLVSGSIMNCWFDGTINGDNDVGGIVGDNESGMIYNCCCFADVVGSKRVGGIVGGTTSSSVIKYCYYTQDSLVGCGEDSATTTAVVAYTKSGADYDLERSVTVGNNATIKLLNALNYWVRSLAPDKTMRYWKIDESREAIVRGIGNHPVHLFPGDSAGVKFVDEPYSDLDRSGNPYSVVYSETATMTELYNSGVSAVKGGHYSISSGEEMKMLSDYVNGGFATTNVTFYLTKDITIAAQCYLTGDTTELEDFTGHAGDGWHPIGRDAKLEDPSNLFRAFRGTFDGCGYTVSGMFATDEKGDELGLFGQGHGCTIKNLGVIGDIVGELKCGGIIGELKNGKVVNCWSAVNIQAEKKIGGIVGDASDSEIINCVAYGAMLAAGGTAAVAGGIVGSTSGKCSIEHCYYFKDATLNAYNDISSNTTADIIAFGYTFSNDDYICSLEKSAVVDDVSTTNLLTALNAWVYADGSGSYSGWHTSSIMITVGKISGHFPTLMNPNEGEEGYNEDYRGDYTATSTMTELYNSGSDGIVGGFYSINGLDDLEALQKYVAAGRRTSDITFFMTRDIDMSQKYSPDTEHSWRPIGNEQKEFRGIFDGQGYTVKYIYITSTDKNLGLFGYVDSPALIKNLGICGAVTGDSNCGSIVGNLTLAKVANCWSSCFVTATADRAGGIAGTSKGGTITNCTSYGAVISPSSYGAICGFPVGTNLDHCYYLNGTCSQAYPIGSTPIAEDVQYFTGTSAACILHEKVTVGGNETRNALSALKLYVDCHPDTNYCYWAIGNTKEYMLMGVEFFPVLLSASGTMGEKDYSVVQAYFGGDEYYSIVKAVNAANDSANGGDVTLAANAVLYKNEDITLDENVNLVTDKYALVIKSTVKLYSLQQLNGYFTLKEGGEIWLWDSDAKDYKLFMYAKKNADASCNSEIYSPDSITFISKPISGASRSAYDLTLQDGEFIVNSTLDSGNPHKIPAGSTLTVDKRGILNVAANARIRTIGDAKIINNGKIIVGKATLDTNGSDKLVGVLEDSNGMVTLPYVYKEGYTLQGWTDGKNVYKAGSGAEVKEAKTLQAKWTLGESSDPYVPDDSQDEEPIYNIPITVIQSNGGSISPKSIKAAKGETLTFTVKPDSGYVLKSVLVDGEAVELDKNNAYTMVSISHEHNIIALFAKLTNSAYKDWKNPFTDISRDSWCYDNVRYAASAGLFNGTTKTTFSPDAPMTRDMVVVVLWRLSGEPKVPDNGVKFPDVPRDNYAFDAVRWANMYGIVLGYFDGTFGYGQPVTREQLTTFIFRYAKNYVNDDVGKYDDTNILYYDDILDVSKGMTQSFQWAIGAGVIKGTTDTTLNPKGTATRAQVAAILSRYCNTFMNTVPVMMK